MLTASQEKFVSISAEIEALKAQLKEKNAELETTAVEIGIGQMFQARDSIVYKIVEPSGTFVAYSKIGFVRTKRPGEDRGTLSAKEAKEAGFKIEG
jgi:hypothetical protein